MDLRVATLESSLEELRIKYVAVCEERDSLKRRADDQTFHELLQSRTEEAGRAKFSSLNATLIAELETHKRYIASVGGEGSLPPDFTPTRMHAVRSTVRRELAMPAELQAAVLSLRQQVAVLTAEKRSLSRQLLAQSLGVGREVLTVRSEHEGEARHLRNQIAHLESEGELSRRTRAVVKRSGGAWLRTLKEMREDLYSIRYAVSQFSGFAFGGGGYGCGEVLIAEEKTTALSATPAFAAEGGGGGIVGILRQAFEGLGSLQVQSSVAEQEALSAFETVEAAINNQCVSRANKNYRCDSSEEEASVSDSQHNHLGSSSPSFPSPLLSPSSTRSGVHHKRKQSTTDNCPAIVTNDPPTDDGKKNPREENHSRRKCFASGKLRRSASSSTGEPSRKKGEERGYGFIKPNFTAFSGFADPSADGESKSQASLSDRANMCVSALIDYCDRLETEAAEARQAARELRKKLADIGNKNGKLKNSSQKRSQEGGELDEDANVSSDLVSVSEKSQWLSRSSLASSGVPSSVNNHRRRSTVVRNSGTSFSIASHSSTPLSRAKGRESTGIVSPSLAALPATPSPRHHGLPLGKASTTRHSVISNAASGKGGAGIVGNGRASSLSSARRSVVFLDDEAKGTSLDAPSISSNRRGSEECGAEGAQGKESELVPSKQPSHSDGDRCSTASALVRLEGAEGRREIGVQVNLSDIGLSEHFTWSSPTAASSGRQADDERTENNMARMGPAPDAVTESNVAGSSPTVASFRKKLLDSAVHYNDGLSVDAATMSVVDITFPEGSRGSASVLVGRTPLINRPMVAKAATNGNDRPRGEEQISAKQEETREEWKCQSGTATSTKNELATGLTNPASRAEELAHKMEVLRNARRTARCFQRWRDRTALQSNKTVGERQPTVTSRSHLFTAISSASPRGMPAGSVSLYIASLATADRARTARPSSAPIVRRGLSSAEGAASRTSRSAWIKHPLSHAPVLVATSPSPIKNTAFTTRDGTSLPQPAVGNLPRNTVIVGPTPPLGYPQVSENLLKHFRESSFRFGRSSHGAHT